MASQILHGRALDALRSLDAAKEQKQRNAQLRNDYLDAEDHHLHLHHQFFSESFADHLHAVRDAADSLRAAFERGTSFSETCKRQPDDRYMEDCGLEVKLAPEDKQDAVTAAANRDTYALHKADALLQETVAALEREGRLPSTGLLKDADSSAADPSDAKALQLQQSIASAVERMKILTQRCAKVVDAAGANSTPFVVPTKLMMSALVDALSIVPIQDRLAPMVAAQSKLTSKNRTLAVSQSASKDEGEIAENESLMVERLTLMEGISDLITQKFHVLDLQDTEVLDATLRRLDETRSEAQQSIQSIRQGAAQRQERLQRDLNALDRAAQRAQADEAVARHGFESALQRSSDSLAHNSQRADEAWAEIRRLEQVLEGLAQERREEVDRRVKLVEREERRRIDMSHFMSFAESHAEAIRSASRSIEAEELLSDMYSDIISQAHHCATSHLGHLRLSIASCRSAAAVEHLAHFREQYLHVGELLFKKERALEELVQRMLYAQAQQELALDALNPNAKAFASLRQELEADVATKRREIEVLKEKSSVYVQSFKPTAALLQSEGRTFEHPCLELIAINKEKSRRIATFHALQVAAGPTSSSRGGAGERIAARTTIPNGAALVEEEIRVLESDRAAVKRLRPPPPAGRAIVPQHELHSGLSAPHDPLD